MAMNVNPQNGDVKTDGVTLYPYEYENVTRTIDSTDYVVSNDGAVVTCFLKLSNGVTISGVHEQYHDKNEDRFKEQAYKQAIERAEQLGYKLY